MLKNLLAFEIVINSRDGDKAKEQAQNFNS
jgi:hypothetical protein